MSELTSIKVLIASFNLPNTNLQRLQHQIADAVLTDAAFIFRP